MDASVGRPGSSRPAAPRGSALAMLVLAATLQFLVLAGTFLLGLAWGGLTYLAALVAGLAGFGVIALLATRAPRAAPLVPLLSLVVSAALYQAGAAYERATACSERLLSAAADVPAITGERHVFAGEAGTGCVARYPSRAQPRRVVDHYRRAFDETGWTVLREGAGNHIAAERDGVVLDVSAPGKVEGGLVVVSVSEVE